jgi:hypothetical protein
MARKWWSANPSTAVVDEYLKAAEWSQGLADTFFRL